MKFPREIRDKIYKEVLTFEYNTTTVYTVIPGQARFRDNGKLVSSAPKKIGYKCNNRRPVIDRIRIWIHPLFLVPGLRDESREVFYKKNTFAVRPKHLMYQELCTRVVNPKFTKFIRHISITLTDFNYGIRFLISHISELEGLRTLNIHSDWNKIDMHIEEHPHKVDRLALEALKLLLDGYSATSIETCFFLKNQRAAYMEAYSQFTQVRDELEELHQPFRFAVLAHIFRRRPAADRVPENKETELASIRSLIELAQHESQHSYPQFDNHAQKPVPFTILHDKQFNRLYPNLRILVYDPMILWDEIEHGTGARSRRRFQNYVLATKDPQTCSEQVNDGWRPRMVEQTVYDDGPVVTVPEFAALDVFQESQGVMDRQDLLNRLENEALPKIDEMEAEIHTSLTANNEGGGEDNNDEEE